MPAVFDQGHRHILGADMAGDSERGPPRHFPITPTVKNP